MIRIQKLKRPNKKSGYALAPGETTEVRGMTITNSKNKFPVHVDKYTRKPWKPKKKKASKKK